MTASIDAELDELADEFDLLGDWEERYRHIIDLGRGLDPLTDAERIEANRVRGCASQVWLVTEPRGDEGLGFRGDSDAHIVRGLIAVVLRLLSGPPRGGDHPLRRQGRLRTARPGRSAFHPALQWTRFNGGADTPRRGGGRLKGAQAARIPVGRSSEGAPTRTS